MNPPQNQEPILLGQIQLVNAIAYAWPDLYPLYGVDNFKLTQRILELTK